VHYAVWCVFVCVCLSVCVCVCVCACVRACEPRCGLGGRLWGGEFQSARSGRRVLGMGQSRLQAGFHGDGGEGVGQVHGLPALLLVSDVSCVRGVAAELRVE